MTKFTKEELEDAVIIYQLDGSQPVKLLSENEVNLQLCQLKGQETEEEENDSI